MKKLIALLSLQLAFSQSPNKMSFQAYLTDNNGLPVAAGTYEMKFTIYTALTDGNKLWEESQSVSVENGSVGVMLGNSVPLVGLNGSGFLEITLNNEVLSPRQELGGSLYAITAASADTADFVDLSNYKGHIRSVSGDDAKISAFSTDVSSASYVSLVAKDNSGVQREIRVYNEGNIGGSFRIYDATRNKNLMVIDTSGTVTAFKFVGDGSQLTGIAQAQNNDDQTLSISGDSLYISEGNSVLLTPYKTIDTDDQTLSISGDSLYISEGNSVALTPYKTIDTDDQILSISGDSLYISEGNSVALTPYKSASNVSSYNVSLGSTALGALTAGDNNTAVGYDALAKNTTATFNTAFGSNTLSTNTTGRENTAMGGKALKLNTTGNYNTATGFNALAANTTAEFNTATGNWAMSNTTTGGGNTGTGNKALMVNTTGANNTSTGYGSLQGNTTGSNNTALGQSAGDVITTGTNNVIIGSGADPSAADGINQIVIGRSAVGAGNNTVQLGNTDITNVKTSGTITAGAVTYPKTDGSANQVLKTDGSGTLAWTTVNGGASSVTGLSDALVENSSVFVGSDPSSTTDGANYNAAFGDNALDNVTTGDDNAALGYDALTSLTTGYRNIAIGSYSLMSLTTAYENVAIGYASMDAATTAWNNVAVGSGSQGKITTGYQNVAVGYTALNDNLTGNDNTGIGNRALRANTGSGNTGVGSSALDYNTTGSKNTAVGQRAMRLGTTGSNNTIMGYQAMGSATNTGDNNVGIGYEVLKSSTESEGNTSVGYRAGDVITTGTNNVILGSEADPSAATGTNQIVIGQGAVGAGDNTVQLGNTNVTNVKTSGTITAGSVTYPKTDGSANQVLKTDGSGTLGWTTVSATPSGAIMMFAASSAPSGWLICDGSTISRTTYADLFSAIGTTYGSGDGSSTFNLPDFGGKGPMGYKSGNSKFDALNETGGEETHTLTANEIPTHTIYSSKTMQGIGTTAGAHSLVGNVSTTSYGGGQAHNVLDPYLTVNFIIKQ